MPEGEFTATVKLKTKSGEWSEDESGKRKCSYCFDVMEITPVVTKRSRSEKKEPDAAEAIMEGMKRVRGSKVMQGDGE
jgi:hypothetical protein